MIILAQIVLFEFRNYFRTNIDREFFIYLTHQSYFLSKHIHYLLKIGPINIFQFKVI